MGRTVLADNETHNYVEQLFKSPQWNVGLIIGQLTNQKDYAVRLIKTPEPVPDEVSEEEEEENVDVKRKRKRSDHKPESLVDADEKWAATHAKQVTRMLPGGLDVIGMFAMAPPNMMQAAQGKLRQILYAIHKTLQKMQVVADDDNIITDRFLLQICSTTRKLTCRSIDVGDLKSTFRPADWKLQSTVDNWIKLHSEISVDLRISVPIRSQNLSFLKQLQSGILPYCENLCSGLILVDGELRQTSELLDKSASESKKSKGKGKDETNKHVYDIDYCVQSNKSKDSDTQITQNVAKMAVRGCMHGRAFVNKKSTVSDAMKAMNTDIMRSLMGRCELLYEDVIDVVEEDSVMQELYNTPVRVFGRLPGSSLDFCDYMFPDERIEEVRERIQELLDISVTEEQLDLQSERMATEDDMTTNFNDKDEETASAGENKSRFNLMTVLGGVVAAAMAGISYYLLGEAT